MGRESRVFPRPSVFSPISMYLLYADESGHPDDQSLHRIVLGGVAVFERQTFWLARELDKIAARFDPVNPDAIELHAALMYHGKGIWRSHARQKREQALADSLQILADSHPANRIFAAVIAKESVSPEDPIEYGFEQLASRFDQFLGRLHKRKNDSQRGIILFDRSTYERTIQSLAQKFRESGHRWGSLKNFAEVPIFADSKSSRLIQLADLVCYAIFQKFEHGSDRLYNIIADRFDEEGGVIHGLHIRE